MLKNIIERLPNKRCFASDVCWIQNTDYISVFATYHGENDLGYKCNLLLFDPSEDHTSLESQGLYNYLTFTLPVYEKIVKM